MTLTKKKFRYVAIFIPNSSLSQKNLIVNRICNQFIDLFGIIQYANSRNRIIKSRHLNSDVLVLKCRLDVISEMILSIYSIKADLMIITISGSLKQLKRRSNDFLIHIAKDSEPTNCGIIKNQIE